MARWVSLSVNLIAALLILMVISLVLSMVFFILTSIGEKTLVNETVCLPPGGEKIYNLPPGMVNVNIVKTDSPVDSTYISPQGGSGRSYGTTGGTSGFGSPLPTRYTIVNPGVTATNVSLRITTGVLNPFGYFDI